MQKWQQPWNAAKAASRRSTRKYKPVGPVGEVPALNPSVDQAMRMRTPMALLLERDFATCHVCGYHVCSCAKDPVPEAKPEPVQSGSLLATYQQMAEAERKLMAEALELRRQEVAEHAEQLRANYSRSAAYQALQQRHQEKRAESMRGQSLDGHAISESQFFLELQDKSGREIALPADPEKRQQAINLLTTGRMNPCSNVQCKLEANHIGPHLVVDPRVPPGGGYLFANPNPGRWQWLVRESE